MLLAIVSVFIYSCKKSQQDKPYFGYDYFPLTKGHWVIYDVDSIYFNDFTGKIDTFHYQIKEQFGESEGDPIAHDKSTSVTIQRFSRTSESNPWAINWVGFATQLKQRLEKVENNQKIVKLTFPIRIGVTWKGNAFNNLDEWDFKYLEVHESFEVQGQNFDSTVFIQQIDEKNLIEERNYSERYARNVGLISREIIDVKTEVDGTIISGLKFYQRIKAYSE